tara:strand:+ start:54168 stop:54677 length:510 start_codon:yes stop_codon:yes gene_type:complete
MDDMLEMSALVQWRVDGQLYELEVMASSTLLDVLRDEVGKKGTHMGCKTGHCGACTVMIDGKVAKSCITLAATLQRATITTIEGLADERGEMGPIQQAFWDQAGFQCGYCAPGILLCTAELLEKNHNPSSEEVDAALAGNLCRCTAYQSIKRSVNEACVRMYPAAESNQ